MEIKGTLEAIFETKEFKSGFKKREFVINTGGDYPQSIKMEVVKDNINKLDAMAVGTPVECKIDIRGRLYEGNYYNNILAVLYQFYAHINIRTRSQKLVENIMNQMIDLNSTI